MLDKNNLFWGLRPSFTLEQEAFVDAIFDPRVKVIVSPSVAGTGKTTLTTGAAKILERDLVYVFPNLCEDEFGFLPGALFEKYYQYLGPMFDALEEIGENPDRCVFNEDAAKDPARMKEHMRLVKEGKIWVYPKPHTFLRGRNLCGNKIIYVDEAQNFTLPQLRKIITRIHEGTKLILTGHMGQCDLPDVKQSGFQHYIDFYETVDYARVIKLTKNFRGQVAQDADRIEEWIRGRE